ncbi:MAG TPA: ABC transporter permease [Kribbella sp.]|nr:ABC transporter permease [Kribbella sp.]
MDAGLDGDQELTAVQEAPGSRPMRRDPAGVRAASFLHRSPGVRLAALLAAPMVWLVVAYLGSLAVMFAAAFWSTDSFTGALIKQASWDNFRTLVEEPVYRRIALRTLGVAATVTVVDALIALPIAVYMAKVARPRARRLLVALILTPLWASYLVKAYAWRILLSSDGPVDWALGPLHLSGPGYGLVAVTLTLAYLWLPFMILPVYAGLDRVPDSLLEASADLGAPAGRTFRSVVLPLIFPALVAGSIFTFSLSLGDYITVKIGGGRTQLFGNGIYDNIGVAANLPCAAAAAVVPVAVILLYLALVRRTGALENL